MRVGMPPTFMWGRGNGRRWTARDRLVVAAWQYLSNTICSGCGHSKLISTDPEFEGYFHAHDDEIVCEGCASAERLAKRNEDSKREPVPGAKAVVDFTWTRPEEVPPDDRAPRPVRPRSRNE